MSRSQRLPTETASGRDLMRAVHYDVKRVVRELCNDVQRPSRLGIFASEAALVRLKASFRAAAHVVRERYAFEAAALARLILEQIAWAYAVHSLDGKAVFAVSPTKSIGKLKEVFPSAGHLYGTLSTYTHIDPNITNEYLDVHGDDGPPAVLSRDNARSNYMALFIGELADVYRVTAEAISFRYFRTPRAWVSEGDQLRLVDDRPLTSALESHRAFLRRRYGRAGA
jgi:hypothetical protein